MSLGQMLPRMQLVYALNLENTLILRGGSESFLSSSLIVKLINESMRKFNVPDGALQNIPTTDRSAVGYLLKMSDYVDVIILEVVNL